VQGEVPLIFLSLANHLQRTTQQLLALGQSPTQPETLATTAATVASAAGGDTIIRFTSREALS